MLTFKSPEDLAELPATDPAYPLVRELIKELIEAYTWEGHPYVAEDYCYLSNERLKQSVSNAHAYEHYLISLRTIHGKSPSRFVVEI